MSFDPIIAGDLTVRLAENTTEVEASQRLRYAVFCGEMGGSANAEVIRQQRDFDDFDNACDHLLVLHQGDVVGTYRLLRQEAMATHMGRYYSESEYDITPIRTYDGRVLELGRSCVRSDFRSRAVMQLLWRGIGAYVAAHSIDVMFGCASFAGDDPQQHALGLSYLYHFHMAPQAICPRALDNLYVNMNILPKEEINEIQAFKTLPVLLKGYLRLGGKVGDGAVLDHAYNTTDVSIVVQAHTVGEKYVARYTLDKR